MRIDFGHLDRRIGKSRKLLFDSTNSLIDNERNLELTLVLLSGMELGTLCIDLSGVIEMLDPQLVLEAMEIIALQLLYTIRSLSLIRYSRAISEDDRNGKRGTGK